MFKKTALVAATIAAIFSTAVPATASASPDDFRAEESGIFSSDSVRPGVSTLAKTADGSATLCSVGFIVRSAAGNGFLSAGHCNADSVGSLYIKLESADRALKVADYTQQAYVGDTTLGPDISLAQVHFGRPINPTTVQGFRFSGVSTPEQLTATKPVKVCKQGATTGLTCGPLVSATGGKIKFKAWADHGDSGGPVWAVWADGRRTAIGVLGGARLSQRDVLYAEAISPWMQKWGLTLA